MEGPLLDAHLLPRTGSSAAAAWTATGWRRAALALFVAAGLIAVTALVHRPNSPSPVAVASAMNDPPHAAENDLPLWCKGTGGTCQIFGCNRWRGETNCINKGSWYNPNRVCFCKQGCSGNDGICYSHVQRSDFLLAENFKLTNVMWPEQQLVIPSRNELLETQLRTANSEGTRFNMYRVPHRLGEKGAKEGSVVLAPVEQLDHVVDFRCDNVLYRWNVRLEMAGLGFSGIAMPYMKVCDPRDADYPHAIVLRGTGRVKRKGGGGCTPRAPGEDVNNASMYIHHGSYEVYGYTRLEKMDSRGYWIPEPPLPFSPPPCDFVIPVPNNSKGER